MFVNAISAEFAVHMFSPRVEIDASGDAMVDDGTAC